MGRGRRRQASKRSSVNRVPKRPPRDLREALQAAGPKPDYANAHTVEEAAQVARMIVAWHARRAAITEAHRRRSQLSDPGLLQERHSPTVEVAVDDPEEKRRARRNLTRVRQSEAWRHNQLTPMQRQAEGELLTVWKLRTAGLGAVATKYGRVPGGVADVVSDRLVNLVNMA
jgi:hypothetical protein